MRPYSGMAALGAAALLVSACSGSEAGSADTDGDGTITQEEVAAEMASGPDVAMRPGQWQTKIEYSQLDLPGVPEGMQDMVKQNMGSGVTTTQCLTDDDLNSANPEAFKAQQDAGCEYEEFDRSGNQMTIRMSCEVPGGGVSKTAMEGEFSEDSYTLEIDGSFTGGPTGDVSMKGTLTGTRIGDCDG